MGGWSLGGAIAFEMAWQLTRMGGDVAFLALFDSQAPLEEDGRNGLSDLELLGHLARSFRVPLDPDVLKPLSPEQQVATVLDVARRLNLVPPDLGQGRLQQLLNVHKSVLHAVMNYRPDPYTGKVHLFKASQIGSRRSTAPDMGWSRYTSVPVEIKTVPGNHFTMLNPPNVRVLGDELSVSLSRE